MKLTPQQYKELYQKLPEPVLDFIHSGDVTKKLYELAEKHHLHIDEAGVLHDIVMDTAMGIIATKNLQGELVRELKLNPLDASRIVQEVDTEVFAPIKQIMVDTYKHSNPFKPQTLQHTEEHDDIDETHLDRNNLLEEIENPPESFKKKEVAIPALETPNETIQKEGEVAQTLPPLNDSLKKLSEKILSSIGDDELPKAVTMQTFVPKEENTVVANTEKPTNIVPEEKVNEIPNIPKTPEPLVNQVVLKEEPEIKIQATEKPSLPTEPKAPLVAPVKPVDPYREPIE